MRSYEESLNHVLINIINNAIDAVGYNGRITIWLREKENIIEIRVIDTGHGIKSDDIDKVYNPFHTTKEPEKGTGLGLYIAYHEIQKLKGQIYFKTKDSVGTTFYIKVPKVLED